MSNGLTAKASTIINYPTSKVWDVLVNPEMISRYVFGTQVATDWKEGSPITIYSQKMWETLLFNLKMFIEK